MPSNLANFEHDGTYSANETNTGPKLAERDKSLSAPVWLSLYYFLFGTVWIFASDFALVQLNMPEQTSYLFSLTKGMTFVAISSLFVFLILRKHVKSVYRANQLARAVVENATDAVFVKDRDGKYLLCNATVANYFGSPIEEIIGKDDSHFFEGKSVETLASIDRQVMETGQAFINEEVLSNQRSTRTFFTSKVPFRDAQGNVIGLIGVARDISRRKEAELQLRAERDRLEKIIETVPMVICSFERGADGSFRMPLASSRVHDLFGKTREELAKDASGCFEYVHPEDLDAVLQSLDHSAKTLEDWQMCGRLRSPVLGEIWLEGRAKPSRQADGSTIWHGYLVDITARQQADEALRESQQRLREAQFIANMGSWSWDPNSNQVWWSEAIYKLFGMEPSRVRPSFEAFLSLLGEADQQVARSRVESVLGGADGFADELQIHRPDGRRIWINSVARATRDEAGRLLRVEGFDQDISERRRLEDQLRQSQKMEAVGRLAGGVAHDFNNLLTVIHGYCEVLQSHLAAESDSRVAVDAILNAAERATQLTRQLLAFSRKAMIEPRTLNLNEVVSQMEIMLRRLIAANISIDIDLEAEPCFIEADATQLDQVILNLALNARDAMPEGGHLRIATKLVDVNTDEEKFAGLKQGGRFVELSVADTGCGMTDEVKAKIFEPFFTTKDTGKGTGLGLAVVHGIVNQSRGRISVESSVNQGTTFRILFAEAAAPTDHSKSVVIGASEGKETLLLVEDEDAVRDLFCVTLESFGYTVLSAPNARAAIEMLEQHKSRIQLLVTDLMMPEMGGRELSKIVRNSVPNLPVLFISGYFDDTLVQEGARNVRDAFLPKPFSPLHLARKVRAVLDENREVSRN